MSASHASKRRLLTDAERIRIVLEGRGCKNVARLCREKRISRSRFYEWQRRFAVLPAREERTNRELEDENATLRALLVDALVRIRSLEGGAEPELTERRARIAGGASYGFPAA
jgi:hypothetical protein